MTRKRFVKKLMATGYSRNKANGCAKRAQACGSSYEDELTKRELTNNGPNVSVRRILHSMGYFKRKDA